MTGRKWAKDRANLYQKIKLTVEEKHMDDIHDGFGHL